LALFLQPIKLRTPKSANNFLLNIFYPRILDSVDLRDGGQFHSFS
jgi:hypothetical protein